MPVKMTPSERRTATQLSSPPMSAAHAVPTTMPAAIGNDVSSHEDHRAVPADPGEGADAEEELVRAPEDEVEADAVEAKTSACTASDVVYGESPNQTDGRSARIAAVTTMGRSAHPDRLPRGPRPGRGSLVVRSPTARGAGGG